MSREAKQAIGVVAAMIFTAVLIVGAFDILHGWVARDRVHTAPAPVKMGDKLT